MIYFSFYVLWVCKKWLLKWNCNAYTWPRGPLVETKGCWSYKIENITLVVSTIGWKLRLFRLLKVLSVKPSRYYSGVRVASEWRRSEVRVASEWRQSDVRVTSGWRQSGPRPSPARLLLGRFFYCYITICVCKTELISIIRAVLHSILKHNFR